MGLLLICPHCQARIPLASPTCLACGAGLRNLPLKDRHYFVGSLAAWEAAPLTPEAAPCPASEVEPVALAETYPETMVPGISSPQDKDVSLCEALDRILNKGAALFGEVLISVADIDLVYLGLQVILASMETARGLKPLGEGQLTPNLFAKGGCR